LEEFYKKIREKLNRPPKSQTDWELWDKISPDIEYNRRGMPLWWWVPALAVISGIIGYFLHFHDEVMELPPRTVYMIDTVYVDKIITKNDTFILERFTDPIVYEDADLKLIPAYALLEKKARLFEQEVEILQAELNEIGKVIFDSSLKHDDRLSPYLEKYLVRTGIENKNKNPLFDLRSITETPYEITSFSYYPIIKGKIPIVRNVFWDHLIKQQQNESLLNKIIPDYFNIGAVLEGPGIALHNDLNPGLDIGYGVQFEALFSPTFSLLFGVNSRTSYGVTEDLVLANSFPQPQNIGEDSRFDKLQIISKSIDIPLSVKYKLVQKSRWDIFLSGGFIFSKFSENEYKYEYKENNTEIYYEIKDKGGNWNLGSFTFGVGTETNIFSRWTLSIAPQFRYHFKSDLPTNYKNHGIGLRVAMMYNL
jgi:hypothetical protein